MLRDGLKNASLRAGDMIFSGLIDRIASELIKVSERVAPSTALQNGA